jgi:hypothetical protein
LSRALIDAMMSYIVPMRDITSHQLRAGVGDGGPAGGEVYARELDASRDEKTRLVRENNFELNAPHAFGSCDPLQ